MKANVIHAVRVILVALLVIGLHRYATATGRNNHETLLSWERINIAEFVPEATRLELIPGEPALRRAIGSDGRSLAVVATSSPAADHVIGYSGPTRLLLVMNADRTIKNVQVMHSFDTPEHLKQVVGSARFWHQFVGWRWGLVTVPKPDGVSGATLTSLAIAESVVTCLSSPRQSTVLEQSFKFPVELTNEETLAWVNPATALGKDLAPSKATRVVASPDGIGRFEIHDPSSASRQWILRTGPLSDDLSGFQGPTELLLRVDANNQLLDACIRGSFDNEPYVRYTRQERSFWKKFKGRPLSDLAVLDLVSEQIDGVSGATMTSLAVAATIRDASKEYLSLLATMQSDATGEMATVTRAPRWNFSGGEILTIIMAIASIFWSGSKLRGNRILRLLWQIICFVVIAMISGNLLSISLISGWTRGGPSYHFAPGLTLLLAVAFTMAIVLKRNVYCDHVCPHGILQQWIRPMGRHRSRPLVVAISRILGSKVMVRLVSTIAWISIAIGFLSLIQPIGIHLSWLEPFDAYLLGIGFSVSLIVWGISLIASRLSPIYYCRNACPTGKILEYVRRTRRRDQLTPIDFTVLIACLWVWIAPVVSAQ